jgi:hypothetical protein
MFVKVPCESLDVWPSIVDDRGHPAPSVKKDHVRATRELTVGNAELRMKAARCGKVVVAVPRSRSAAKARMAAGRASGFVDAPASAWERL